MRKGGVALTWFSMPPSAAASTGLCVRNRGLERWVDELMAMTWFKRGGRTLRSQVLMEGTIVVSARRPIERHHHQAVNYNSRPRCGMNLVTSLPPIRCSFV